MSLKAPFAVVLRTLRGVRNISQRDFGDTSRTFLSKLEGARASITLDKLEQVSQRLDLSPLTLLTLTLQEQTGKTAARLIEELLREIECLEADGRSAEPVALLAQLRQIDQVEQLPPPHV